MSRISGPSQFTSGFAVTRMPGLLQICLRAVLSSRRSTQVFRAAVGRVGLLHRELFRKARTHSGCITRLQQGIV